MGLLNVTIHQLVNDNGLFYRAHFVEGYRCRVLQRFLDDKAFEQKAARIRSRVEAIAERANHSEGEEA